MQLKSYKDLRIGDEFDAYCGAKYQRVKVLAGPGRDGDRVWVKVKTISKQVHTGETFKLTFVADTTVSLYSEGGSSDELLQTYKEWVLANLQPTEQWLSFEEIRQRIVTEFGICDRVALDIVLSQLSQINKGVEPIFHRDTTGGERSYRRASEKAVSELQYQAMVISVLERNAWPIKTIEVVDRIWERHRVHCNVDTLRPRMKVMAESGLIYCLSHQRDLFWRLPIVWQIGLPVVENYATKSERYGWIESLQEINGSIQPVCRWTTFTRSASSQDLLQICTKERDLNRIALARVAYNGGATNHRPLKPEHFEDFFTEIGNIRATKLRTIGEYLGIWCAEEAERSRKAVIDHLDILYPHWRKGDHRSVFEFMEVAS